MQNQHVEHGAHVAVRMASRGDAGDIANLHKSIFDQGWSVTVIDELITDQTSSVFIASGHDQAPPVGFLIARLCADEAEILSLGVAPEFRARGFARKLLAQMLETMESNGARAVFLEVAADNQPALSLYHAFGFSRKGIRKGYYKRANAEACDAWTLKLAHPFSAS